MSQALSAPLHPGARHECGRPAHAYPDTHPDDPRIVFAAGFSGHGFKFGPLTGRILAELAIFGGSQVLEFNRFRRTFSLDFGNLSQGVQS